MGCACIRISTSVAPKTKTHVVKMFSRANQNIKRNYLYSLKMESWVQILDYLPYKHLRISGKVCRSQALLSKFFKNHNYKIPFENLKTYNKRADITEISNNLYSNCSVLTPDKYIPESPKFPNGRKVNFPCDLEGKKKIKSSCIDFFSKGESENNTYNQNICMNKSKETISEMDKTPNFNLHESIVQSIQLTINHSEGNKKKNSLFDINNRSNQSINNKTENSKNINKKQTNSLSEKPIDVEKLKKTNSRVMISDNTEDTNLILK